MSNVAPGWYADPQNTSFLRWWDGFRWSQHTRPAAAQQSYFHAPVSARAAAVPIPAVPTAAPAAAGDVASLKAEYADLSSRVIELREIAMLQEVGLYRYAHPLESTAAYKDRLKNLDKRITEMAKKGEAVKGATSWSVNGSQQEGAKMIGDLSKLMLRAYNNEAENAVRSMKPYALESAKKRIEQSRATITKLGARMQIQVSDAYHRLRLEELELTADYLVKLAEEKEAERERRARLREEEKARKEQEEKIAALVKERSQRQLAYDQLVARGDTVAAAAMQEQLAELDTAIEGVKKRAANGRAGFVYVISNHGAFGEEVVKIGMTRREEPRERVHELGDASVPFRFDVHVIVFSEDAVDLETRLHKEFADRRVNMVNMHREFFFVSPGTVKDAMTRFGVNLLEFNERSEALEWRASRKERPANFTATSGALQAPPRGVPSDLPPPGEA